MVKTLKSKHRNHKDLSKKRGLKQRAGMNKQLYIPHATQISGGERLLYDDYPRSEEIEQAFPNQAVYTFLMSSDQNTLVGIKGLHDKQLIYLDDNGKIKVVSLQKLAVEATKETMSDLLKYIINQMKDDQFRAFLFYYLVALNSEDSEELVPTLDQPEFNLREDEREKKCLLINNNINLFLLFEEIIQAMCAMSKSYDFSGSRFFGIGKKDDFTKQPEKRLVQFFSLYFHDFCSQDPGSMYRTMQSLIRDGKDKKPDISTFKNLYSLFGSRFSGAELNDPVDYNNQQKNIIKSQQILFYLCFWLITSKIMPRGPIEVFSLRDESYSLIRDMNAKIDKMNAKIDKMNKINYQKFDDATKRVKLEKVILGDSTFTTFPNLKEMITFSEESSEKLPEYDFTKSVCYQNYQVGTTIDCTNKASDVSTFQPGVGGKKSRKSTSKTHKPKTLKRPLRANHRIKKATSVESRKRVSKNRNTSYRRA